MTELTDYTVVEWGDPVEGGGFLWYHDPERPEPGRPYQKAAELLQRDAVQQPPEDAEDSARHPVWALRHVEVDGVGPHWCFTVQGRGGAFGRYGGCQFLFTPGTADPLVLWRTATSMVGPDGRLGYAPDGPGLTGSGTVGALVPAIRGLLYGHRVVVVDGEPSDVAAAIHGLLAVLPIPVVRKHVWQTYPLRVPVFEQSRPMVSGRWPGELADRDFALRVSRWLDEPTAHLGKTDPGPRADEVALWLAGTAAEGRVLDGYRNLPHLPALIDVVTREQLTPPRVELPDLVAAADPVLRQDRLAGPLRDWVRDSPDAAISRLLSQPPDWLTDRIFPVLIEAHVDSPATNPLRFPPSSDQRFPGWHALLVRLLRRHFRGRGELAAFVRDHLRAYGGPLHTRQAAMSARKWLLDLGLSERDASIFPIHTEKIAGWVRDHGRLNVRDHDLLRSSPDLVEEVSLVVASVGYVSPVLAADLLLLVETDDTAHRMVERLVRHNDQFTALPAAPAEEWMGDLLAHSLPEPAELAVIRVGVRHLAERGARPMPPTFLSSALNAIANRADMDPSFQRVLRDSADHLNAPPPPPRDVVPDYDDSWPAEEPPEEPPEDEQEPEPEPPPLPMTTTKIVVLWLLGTLCVMLLLWLLVDVLLVRTR